MTRPAPAGSATSQQTTSKPKSKTSTPASSELPAAWAERLREEMAAEIVERQRADAAQRELLTRRVAKAEAQRRKLLDAYYIDVTTLKSEQARIGADVQVAKDRLGDLDANLGEWQEILELAATFAIRCGDAYAKASDRTRKQFNAAVFERLDVKDGRHCHEQYRPPFDDIFSVCEFRMRNSSGGGGNRTRVLRLLIEPSPSAAGRKLSGAPLLPAATAPRIRQSVPAGRPKRPTGKLHWMTPVHQPVEQRLGGRRY
jgi:hypothetical protein